MRAERDRQTNMQMEGCELRVNRMKQEMRMGRCRVTWVERERDTDGQRGIGTQRSRESGRRESEIDTCGKQQAWTDREEESERCRPRACSYTHLTPPMTLRVVTYFGGVYF